MGAYKVLIIEDDTETAENIRLYLEHHGFSCSVADSGAAGISAFEVEHPHIIILDLMLPDMDGRSVCRRLRKSSDVPILMLTARVSDQNVADGLDAGADDYVRKPYSNKELVARVKAHLRRQAPQGNGVSVGPFFLDELNGTVSAAGKILDLTKTEYLILQAFLKAPERIFSREQLYETVFGLMHESFDQTINVHLHNLRKKIVQAGVAEHGIKSVYGMGYKLVVS